MAEPTSGQYQASIRGDCIRRICKSEEYCFHRICSARVLGNGRLVLDNGFHTRLADVDEVRRVGKQ